MRRFVAAPWIAVAFATAAWACGSLKPTQGFQPLEDAGEDSGGASAKDSGSPTNERDATTPENDGAPNGEDGAAPAEDATAPEEDATPGVDAAPVVEAGPTEDGGHGTVPPGAALGSCDPRRWTITASSSHVANPAKYLNDGLPPTRWSSGVAQAAGQYVQIDFGGYVVLEELTFDSSFTTTDRTDYPRAFDVLASDDGTTFPQTITSKSLAADPGAAVVVSFAPYATRAVRVSLTATSTTWWTAHEIAAKCTVPGGEDAGTDAGARDAATNGPALAHTGWSATANFTSTTTTDPVTGAYDGNASTRWASGKLQFGDEIFRLDLGAPSSVSQLWLTSNATDYPSAYSLEVSSDDVSYSEVATGLGGPTTKILFPTQTTRYLRVKQIGSGYGKWWCIYETSVYP